MDRYMEKLSNYIDSLNEERKPRERDRGMEELYQTVRLVSRLKEPSLPGPKFDEKLRRVLAVKNSRKTRKRQYMGIDSIAAAIALIVTISSLGFIGKTNLVNTMGQAFKEIKAVEVNYVSGDKKVTILQKKVTDKFKLASSAVLGKVDNNTVEIQSPIQNETGVLLGGGAYAGITGISSVRWQQDGFEYAVIGNTSLDELGLFVKGLVNGPIELNSQESQSLGNPKINVSYDLQSEEGDQKNVDAGHSPWKLDPAFVAQVFVSLKLSPGGIQGDYPIDYEEFKIAQNNGKEAVVEVGGKKTPISKVYLKRLIRQDNTGIWTVVGYDPK